MSDLHKKLQEVAIKYTKDKYTPHYEIYHRMHHGMGSYPILGIRIAGLQREIKYDNSKSFDDNILDNLREFERYHG